MRRQSSRWIIVAIVVAVLIVAALVWLNQQSIAAPPPNALGQCGTPTCGQANAPVTIEIYADFQCPFCAQADGVLQQLAPKYVDTGKVKLVYHDIAIIGPESNTAAQAAECAADQNKFWTYANYLFTHQGAENSGTFSADHLKSFAVQLGLNANTFNTCLDSGKYASQVQQETTQAGQRGVTATPTFFINGQRYEGFMSYDQMVALIEGDLPKP